MNFYGRTIFGMTIFFYKRKGHRSSVVIFVGVNRRRILFFWVEPLGKK